MVSATSNATSNTGSTSPLTLNLSNTNSTGSVDAFAQQLAAAIEGYLGTVQNGSHFEIDVQSGQDRSLTVSVKDLGTTSSTTTATPPTASTTSAAASIATTNSTTSSAVTSSPATSSATATSASGTVDKSKMTPTDAYWAEQPPAVQALRDMPDDERFSAAQQLAKEGYSIDVPIMVWGWDPLVTMTLRQQEGYTWVPSGMQTNNFIGPGITNVWNLPSYDPNNPPPGSIQVSTDFAKGTNMQDPWIQSLSAT